MAIIGAGPVGLECAHYALSCGFAVRVFDGADSIACQMRAWQHLTMFSSWGYLRTPLGARVAQEQGARLAADALYPTASELVVHYLEPLAAALPDKTLWLQHRVVGVTRAYALPDDAEESLEQRAHRPFRIVTRNSSSGEERAWSAEHVIDCTSGGRTHAWLGCGGLPAIGEMGSTHKIWRSTPDISGADRGAFAGRKTLLVGDGPSAASSAILLAALAESDPSTSFFWAVASNRELPCKMDEPSPGLSAPRAHTLSARRTLLASKANLLVKSAKPYLAYSRLTQVEEVRYSLEMKKFLVTLQVDRQTKRYQFDNIIANVGWRREALYLKRLREGEVGFYEVGALCGNTDHALYAAQEEIRGAFRQITANPGLDMYGGSDTPAAA